MTTVAAINAAGRFDQRDHLEQRRSGRDDIVDEHDTLAGLDPEATAEFAMAAAVGGLDAFSEEAARAEVARHLEGEKNAARRRTDDDIDGLVLRRPRALDRP